MTEFILDWCLRLMLVALLLSCIAIVCLLAAIPYALWVALRAFNG